MLPRLRLDLPDRLAELQGLLAAVEVELHQPPDRAASLAVLLPQLTKFIQTQLLPLEEDAFPSRYRQKWPGIRTELQRTVKLLETELVFWRSARTPERKKYYQGRLLGHCQHLNDFGQLLHTILGSPSGV